MKMTKKHYLKRMKQHEATFDRLWVKITTETNQFIQDNPTERIGYYDQGGNRIEAFVDQLSLSGAWIRDRLDGKSGRPHSNNYRGSLTKKIRKALGYNL